MPGQPFAEAFMAIDPLPTSALYRRTDLKALDFKTTRELEDVDTLIGQDRALEACGLARGCGREGTISS
jgi:hypothetical protein